MPIDLTEKLYRHIFENPYHITEDTCLQWLHSLSGEELQKVRRTKTVDPIE